MKRVLVTGGDKGLGETLVRLMELEKHQVKFTSQSLMRNATRLDIESAIRRIGPVDWVINNFGINRLVEIGNASDGGDWDILWNNVMVPYWVVSVLVQQGIGPCRVVNVASQTYRVPQRHTALYCASKAALVQMTKVMARELAPKGWIINAVAPGKMPDTDMSQITDAQVLKLRGWTQEEADEYAKKLIPMGRFTDRVEIAYVVRDVLRLPDYVNGAVIDATGGV